MNGEDLPKLSDAARSLLDAERGDVVVPPPDARHAVFARLTQTLALPDLGDVGAARDAPGADAVTGDAVTGASGAATAASGVGAATGSVGLSAKLISVAVASFLIGSAVGAGALALLRPPPEPRVEYVKVEVPFAVPAPRPTPSDPVPIDEPALVEKSERRPKAPPPKLEPAEEPPPQRITVTPLPTIEETLEAERTLLERARTALSRGKPDDATQALKKHEADFPNGQLVEEREVLFIQALVTARQFDDARARAKTFREQHPRSILLPTVDAVLENSP